MQEHGTMREMTPQTRFPTVNGSRRNGVTPDIRQRASTSNQHRSPTHRELDSRTKGHRNQSEKDRKGKGKAKAKWEVGTKGWVKEGFRRFGEHCARNQIRTLLIDCLVMTNLFYPSLAVWYQKRAPSRTTNDMPHAGPSRLPHSQSSSQGSSSIWSTPLLDSIYPDPSPFLPPLDAGGWWHTDHPKDDPSANRWNGTRVARRRSRQEHPDDEELRLVRVGWTDVDRIQRYRPGQDVECRQWSQRELDLLAAVQEVANSWEGDHPGSRERCVRELGSDDSGDSEAPCVEVAINPCEDPDSNLKASDRQTLSSSSTYQWTANVFRLPRESTGEFNRRWAQVMQGIAEQQAGVTFVNNPSRPRSADPWSGDWDLSFSPETTPSDIHNDNNDTHKSENPYAKYFVLLYIAMFCILAFQVNFATRVHSKFGLAVTGIVQLCCSAIMSLSVLALIGWNGWGWSSLPSSVPIWVLPMVIVIVGVENMSTMTKAVFSVPFHYSVPERIGLGLSRSGMKILYTTLANIFALAIIWYFVDVVPVREFCLFAITVHITDWFMLHTFYLTVISIDAQRLELADVLATSGNQDPATQTVSIEESDDAASIFSWRGLLAGRMFRSGTLFLTLFCIGVIYLVTDRGTSSLSNPSELYAYAKATATALPSSSPFATFKEALANMTKDELLWRAVNPQNWPTVRMTISSAFIIILPSERNPITPNDILRLAEPVSRAAWLPQVKKLLYLAKVLILPQAATAGSLWALLRYLLKDADLLDAQRDRLGRGEEASYDDRTSQDRSSLAARSSVHMLPCGHACDIERIATSRAGNTVITVGLDNSIALWRFADTPGTGTREMLKLSDIMRASAVVAVAVCSEGKYVAVATRQGSVQIWRVGQSDASRSLPPITIGRDSRRLVDIKFDSISQTLDDPFRAPTIQTGSSAGGHPRIVLVYNDGTVLAVTESDTIVTLHDASDSNTRTLLLRSDDETDMALFTISSHGLLLSRSSDGWRSTPLESHSTPGDRITAVSPIRHHVQDTSLIAIGRQSGLVEIFDASSGELAGSIGQSQHLEGISRVDLASPSVSRCTGCGTTSNAGYTVISSSGDQVYVDRVIPPNTIICRCSNPRRSLEDNAARPYRSASSGDGSPVKSRSTESLVVPPCSARAKLSPNSSPRRSPSLLPPTSNGEFPLSSHGTRKLSAYQAYETSNTTTPTTAHHGKMPTAATSVGYVFDDSLNQQTAVGWADMEILPLGSVIAPSGTWAIVSDTIIGLRRSSSGIGHEQWQIWTIDLTSPYNGVTLNVDIASLAYMEEETRHALFESMLDDHGGISTSTQRAERLHSISGRATFPSIRGSFSVPTFPQLAYVDIRTIATKGTDSVVVGFGNQLGVITLPSRNHLQVRERVSTQGLTLGLSAQRTPRSRLGSSSGLDRRVIPTALGLTPPPPRKVSEDRKAV